MENMKHMKNMKNTKNFSTILERMGPPVFLKRKLD